MRPGILTIILAVSSIFSFAQSKRVVLNPAIKNGVTLEYEVVAQGQAIPLIMTVSAISDAEIILDYTFAGETTGRFVNTKLNLEKGAFLNWDQPVAGEERRLAEDQTLGMVSRPFLKDLKAKKKAKYDGMDFTIKPIAVGEEIVIDGKTIDALFAESESGSTRMWILNNDKYPVLLKITGTAAGIDMTLQNIR